MGQGRASAALGAALALVLALSGCSGKEHKSPAAPPLSPSSLYEKAVVADGAAALWSFRDATGLSARDEVADLTDGRAAGTVIGGTIAETTGPEGAPAARFLRSGRVVTPVTTGLTSSDTFSIELDLRADSCVSAWGRVLGTTSLASTGREGFELLHFPKQFAVSPCRFGVEFWHLNHYLGGCHPKGPAAVGVWTHWAIVYAAGRVSCYANGTLFQSGVLRGTKLFRQLGPLGLGGSGSGFQGPLDGASLGEVAFYRRALSPVEVERHARLSTAPAPKPSASPAPTRSS
ncbi:MAG: LamG-like jellyroll fold domain-containing protein [Mycobacteriales bacterium]